MIHMIQELFGRTLIDLADSQITMNDVVIVCRTILVWFDDKGHYSAFALRGIFGLTRIHRVTVPSGKWLEFGVARYPGNMKVSFQAARSIG
jgi:hypothetical protein